MELFILLPGLVSMNFLHKMFHILSKSTNLILKTGNGIIQTGNGIIFPTSKPLVEQLYNTIQIMPGIAALVKIQNEIDYFVS